MAGYWPSFINSQKKIEANLVNEGFIIWLSGKFFKRDRAGSPERARWLHLERSGSQSQRAIWFILPARGATCSHIINIYYLPAGRSVWWKTVTKGSIFKPKVTVFHHTADLSRQITCLLFFPAVNWLYRLQITLFPQLLSFSGLARRLPTICEKPWQRTRNSDSRQKKDVLKNRLF